MNTRESNELSLLCSLRSPYVHKKQIETNNALG